ncbi:MAG TPA: hypothetical protein VFS26_09905 [Solirubrobacterales bacterium]|nr:hypothetical protein [Solirubrobacterales bacterium]
MSDGETSTKYDVAIVEAVVLQVVAELHPEKLTGTELALEVVADRADARELATAARAIRNLRECGLLADRDDEIVEPTPAALRACALLG